MTDPLAAVPRWTRRDVMKTGVAVAAAAGTFGLAGRPVLANEVPLEYDGSKFQLKAPEPNPKYGGMLRYGITMRPPHFDIHQAGTINTLAAMAVMYDNLIRRDPRDSGQTIIPDLAHSWQISKDGKTYTFFLRKGVQFHDGAELTAEDVKATFDRIRKPPSGIAIPRSVLFKSVEEITTPDKYTVQFKLAESRPVNFIMSAIASGWNVIVRKHTLEDNHYDLRRVQNYPGTGPFGSVKYVETETWEMKKNKNYWNKGLPYLDGITFYHALPFSTELGSAILSGRVDYIRITDPVTWQKAKDTPGLSVARFNQSVIQGVWVNTKRKPLDDPRVRRALHLAFDRPALIEVVKDVTPMQVGGFIYPFSEWATPKTELFERIGYQSDTAAAVKEAQSLMAAAGYANGIKGLDFLVRDVPSFKLWSQAIQSMLQESLGVECKLRTVVEIGVVWRHPEREFRSSDRRHRLDAARPVRLFQRLVSGRRPAKLLILARAEIRCPCRPNRPRNRSEAASGAGAPGRADHGAEPARIAGRVGTDQRCLVQLCQGAQPLSLLRHLRRRPRGHVLARQDLSIRWPSTLRSGAEKNPAAGLDLA